MSCSRVALIISLLLIPIALAMMEGRHVLREKLPPQPHQYAVIGRARRNLLLPFSIHLRQQNLPKLFDLARRISDPDSALYRKFLTAEQVISMTATSSNDLEAALSFTSQFQDAQCSLASDLVTLHCTAPVDTIEKMFSTTLHVVERIGAAKSSSKYRAVTHLHSISVPRSLKDVIEVVSGITLLPKVKVNSNIMGGSKQSVVEFTETIGAARAILTTSSSERMVPGDMTSQCSSTQRSCVDDINQIEGCCPANTTCCLNLQNGLQCCKARLQCCRGECVDPFTSSCKDAGAEEFITPDTLRHLYNVPAGQRAAPSSSTMQSITAFEDDYSQGALVYFTTVFSEDGVPNITRKGGFCITEGCDQVESDLDIQYITSMGKDVPTWFWFNNGTEYTLEWAKKVLNTKNPPVVHSISYISGEYQLGQSYVLASNAEFVKLGSMGVTIMACAGDTGTTGWSVNYPIPTGPENVLYPCEDCPPADQPNMCSQITLKSGKSFCNVPSGLHSRDAEREQTCFQLLSNASVCSDALKAFTTAAATKCGFSVGTDENDVARLFSAKCTCDQLPTITRGDCTVEGYQFNMENGSPVTSLYPASSPYITAVGATQLTSFPNDACGQTMPGNQTVHCEPSEVVSSISTGARITSGGGFSTISPMESYQSKEVSRYLAYNFSFNPPKVAYDPKNRGYPDVAFNGHNWLVARSTNMTHEQCPCSLLAVDGTSCSSPGFSGLVSLMVSEVEAAGHGRGLGLLNPLLYRVAEKNPSAFNDIVRGRNACTEATCSVWGWHAARGWDPSSGLGTPNFQELLNAVLSEASNASNEVVQG